MPGGIELDDVIAHSRPVGGSHAQAKLQIANGENIAFVQHVLLDLLIVHKAAVGAASVFHDDCVWSHQQTRVMTADHFRRNENVVVVGTANRHHTTIEYDRIA